jgi:hypothetical protein
MALAGHTQANRVLDELLAMNDSDLRNALGIAREYADHPSILGVGIPAGNRLLIQVEHGIKEIKSV